MSFEQDIAVVTGAASGIGLGTAQALHRAGASVVVSDVNEAGLEAARDAFDSKDRLLFVRADVRDETAITHLVSQAESTFGPPTIMVANAGIVPNISVLTMTTEEWDLALEINLRGVFLACQAAARSMVAHGVHGNIVTITSGARNQGRLGASAYCSSKAGIEMFTKVLAMEVAEYGINVNSVAPGVISIPGRATTMRSEFGTMIEAGIPKGHRGTPDDVAQAILFLCSPQASYITGIVLPVDGGAGTGRTNLPYSSPQRPIPPYPSPSTAEPNH